MKRPMRYVRNGLIINEDDQIKLKKSKVCILGCGGLGGYTIEMFARTGVGNIKVIDGDVFDETNWNRQLLSNHKNLGKSKAKAAKERVKIINDEIQIDGICEFINKSNVEKHLKGCDLVVDGLDQIIVRKMVVESCKKLKIPYIYGAIAGWYGQVATIMPDDKILDLIYRTDLNRGEEVHLGNPSFTPPLVASFQVSESIKYLLGKGDLLTNGFIHIDLLCNEIEKIHFDK
ncbi:MAG: HesA/MoeB/ThiF family protein [Clostridiales bacterium]